MVSTPSILMGAMFCGPISLPQASGLATEALTSCACLAEILIFGSDLLESF